MSNLNHTLFILQQVFQLVFSLWPLLVIGGLDKRGNPFMNMFILWCFVALMRLFLVFNPSPPPPILLPEPLNTVLFFVAGLLLFVVVLVDKRRKRKQFLKRMEDTRSREDMLNLSPAEFENLVVELYRASGHNAKRTGAVGVL